MAFYRASDEELTGIADAIRERGGTSDALEFPDEFESAIRNIPAEGITVETDPTVPAWAKQPTKPAYTAQEVGALPDDTPIPTKTSDLTNDSGFITGYTETDPTVPAWAKAANKPTYTADEVGAIGNPYVMTGVNIGAPDNGLSTGQTANKRIYVVDAGSRVVGELSITASYTGDISIAMYANNMYNAVGWVRGIQITHKKDSSHTVEYSVADPANFCAAIEASPEIKKKTATISSVTIGASGTANISASMPSGMNNFLYATVWGFGSKAPAGAMFGVTGDGNYIYGAAGTAITNLQIAYFYTD